MNSLIDLFFVHGDDVFEGALFCGHTPPMLGQGNRGVMYSVVETLSAILIKNLGAIQTI